MALLELREVTFGYATRPVLRGVSLSVEPRSVTALLGPNGAGKTTMLNSCLGWNRPWSGEVLLEGTPLAALGRREIGRRIALVPQNEHVAFDYSILDYVLLGRAPHLAPLATPDQSDVDTAVAALDRVGLSARASDPVQATSAGERQLVLLARALAQATLLLLLDEPAAHLDLRNKRRLVDLLKQEVARGATLLLSTHEPELVDAIATDVVLLKDGAVVARGEPDTVLTSELLAGAYETPVEVGMAAGRRYVRW